MVGHVDENFAPHYHQARYARKTSVLAVLSLISGIISLPMMCCVIVSIPFSVFAIVCGHLSRGLIRQSQGEYSGTEMATSGLLLGYFSLLVVGAVLLYGFSRIDRPNVEFAYSESAENNAGRMLLKQAEDILLNESTVAAGSSTSDADAKALALHVVETLIVFDRTHLEAAGTAASGGDEATIKTEEGAQYRAFAQVNADSIAVLIHVSNLDRFTDEAHGLLKERCWLIVQRSVDDLLPENADLAVAIYDSTGQNAVMMGHATRSGSAAAGLQTQPADNGQLAKFFRLTERRRPSRDRSAAAAPGAAKPPIDAGPYPNASAVESASPSAIGNRQ